MFMRTVVVLAMLCAPTSSLCLRFYHPDSNLLCQEIISAVKGGEVPSLGTSDSMSESWDPLFNPEDALSSESREKRTYPASSNYRYLSQTQLRSKLFQNSPKSDRRSKFTLSLDVPTNIMNILFNIAKSKNLRAKAADNARLMAQIGRRK